MKFKNTPPGLFRNTDGIIYSKLTTPLSDKEKPEETFNAILITSGRPVNIDDNTEITEW